MTIQQSLDWFNQLLTVTLHPEKIETGVIKEEQLLQVSREIQERNTLLQLLFKKDVFSSCNRNEAALQIQHYHTALMLLLDEACIHKKQIPGRNAAIKKLYQEVISSLSALLYFIETRFHPYLGLDEPLPFNYVKTVQKELRQQLEILELRLSKKPAGIKEMDVVLKVMYDFTDLIDSHIPVTARDVLYKKELVNKLGDLEGMHDQIHLFHELDRLLVYMNFNSKSYADSLTRRVKEQLEAISLDAEKMRYLLFYRKEFRQMHYRGDIAMNRRYHNLKDLVDNWFEQELLYLERTAVTSQEQKISGWVTGEGKPKLVCSLSVDQISLLLRAANDLKILLARSLNAVFKAIVPFLSTPHAKELSWDSMRSKSYAAEYRDKEVVVNMLQQLIVKIKSY